MAKTTQVTVTIGGKINTGEYSSVTFETTQSVELEEGDSAKVERRKLAKILWREFREFKDKLHTRKDK